MHGRSLDGQECCVIARWSRSASAEDLRVISHRFLQVIRTGPGVRTRDRPTAITTRAHHGRLEEAIPTRLVAARRGLPDRMGIRRELAKQGLFAPASDRLALRRRMVGALGREAGYLQRRASKDEWP